MSIDVMQQALDALENALSDDKPYIRKSQAAITALRTAIEQAEKQEPLTDSFVQQVPDKCDRIVWRGSYYHLSPAAQPAIDLQFLKQVVGVAIAGLYEEYPDDVLKNFSTSQLEEVVSITDPLRPQQVEDLYKRAWDMLAAAPEAPAQPAPVQEPESFEQWNAKQHGDPEEIGFLQALRIAYCAGQDSVTNATPPAAQRQPLTDEEIGRLTADPRWRSMAVPGLLTFARAIEAAHGIKEST